ncbi:hypothetical protein EsVE80_24570 [Enterococcus saigonensis]|uniref:Uncharacterized protein n=1 Tax=Enterococcus saigonensis TaxID=1805431 RepID=A0A679IRZ2_9ENTE|nr:hypothetical protein [Enterococcus saigonensis]BCA86934.1 hypothetical protein EsVE80_24570 [Enterococcus saigonensis]
MIKKNNLLLLASLVWLVAGFNILKIGIETYTGYVTFFNLFLSVLVFVTFWFMIFSKLVTKHTLRIDHYDEEKQFFLKFFDVKSFLIMAVMIIGGVTIRTFHLLPNRFIAVFYTGLGTALFLAGVLFGINFFKAKK